MRTVDMNGVLTNGTCLQRKIMRHCRILDPFGGSTSPECVGKLCDSEYPPATMAGALSLAHTRKQAQVVSFKCLLSALVSKLALGTMAVENQLGRRIAGKQGANLRCQFSHFARKRT